MKEISDEDFIKIARKVIRLITTIDPVKRSEIARERRNQNEQRNHLLLN